MVLVLEEGEMMISLLLLDVRREGEIWCDITFFLNDQICHLGELLVCIYHWGWDSCGEVY